MSIMIQVIRLTGNIPLNRSAGYKPEAKRKRTFKFISTAILRQTGRGGHENFISGRIYLVSGQF